MRTLDIFFDVDYTILGLDGSLRPWTREVFERLVGTVTGCMSGPASATARRCCASTGSSTWWRPATTSR